MTKSQIKKLGKKIRKSLVSNNQIEINDLLKLQEFRLSFLQGIKAVFRTLASEVNKDNIILSSRIKRIESIISKIKRQPTMSLDKMGDIAGCRLIFENLDDLENSYQKISGLFDVIKVRDYLRIPKEDGYKGLHLYIANPEKKGYLIEIQLRTTRMHDWSSLVEAIDNIYNLKIKEGQRNSDMYTFLKLLSFEYQNLSTEEMKRIFQIDHQHGLSKKLVDIFFYNNIRIRRKWIRTKIVGNEYFVFELQNNSESNFEVFSKHKDAENFYFERFRDEANINAVLALIKNPSFNNICKAYSSYLLIDNNYFDWYFSYLYEREMEAMQELLKQDSKSSSLDFNESALYLNYLAEVETQRIENLGKEMTEIGNIANKRDDLAYNQISELEEWFDSLKSNLDRANRINKKLEERQLELNALINKTEANKG